MTPVPSPSKPSIPPPATPVVLVKGHVAEEKPTLLAKDTEQKVQVKKSVESNVKEGVHGKNEIKPIDEERIRREAAWGTTDELKSADSVDAEKKRKKLQKLREQEEEEEVKKPSKKRSRK